MSVSFEREGRKGLLGWFKSVFHVGEKSYEWEDKIQVIVFKLKEQQEKLDELYYRIKGRAQELFQKTVEHVKKAKDPSLKTEERKAHENLARTFAEEIYEIRAFLRAIRFTSISLERAAQRLQTVRDIKDFQEVLLPVSQLLTGVKNEISTIFPNVGEALDEINKSITELMIQTSSGLHTPPSSGFAVNEDVDKILGEAWRAAEQSVDDQIPVPSRIIKQHAMIEEDVGEEKVTKPINVVVKTGTRRSVLKKAQPVPVPSPLRNASIVKLEELLLDEIRVNNGRLDINDFVSKYRVDKDRVFEALHNLSRKGKIRLANRKRGRSY